MGIPDPWACARAENGPDCKSGGFGLRGFKSHLALLRIFGGLAEPGLLHLIANQVAEATPWRVGSNPTPSAVLGELAELA